MTGPEWYALGAGLVVAGAWVAAGTVATRAAHGRRDGQDSAPPTTDAEQEWAEIMAETRDLRAWRGKEPTSNEGETR